MAIHDTTYLKILNRHLPGDPLRLAETLLTALKQRARLTPAKTACYFSNKPTTYKELFAGICNFAAYLRQFDIKKGDRVILKLENSREFFFAYYGVQRLGAIAVPIYHNSSIERIATLTGISLARALVTSQALSPEKEAGITGLMKRDGIHFLNLPEGIRFKGDVDDIPFPRPGDLAMLQYTSGTTGDPKGVMLTHGNLLANVRQMIPKARFTEKDVFVSWLPVYHDMGLITMTMCPFYLGALLVLLPVSLKPDSWFEAIKKYKGTMTAAPDFAYRFATKLSRKGSAYDLSSLRVALIAAEPVRAKTVADFEEKFGLHNVLKPGYGLAESSVAVTFWDRDGKIKVDENNHVSAGTPLPGLELAVASGKDFCCVNEVGEIVFRSPSATSGYYRNEAATKNLHFKDGYIRSGDIGYLDNENNLFIVDRAKNVIIRAGRNISPREIEEIADTIPDVRTSAVFGVDENSIDGERIHLVVEVNSLNRNLKNILVSLPGKIMEKVYQVLGYKPDHIHIVKQKTIPRTYNGKIKYPELKYLFLTDKMAERVLN